MDLLLLDLLQYSRLNGWSLELVPVDLDLALNDVLTSNRQEIENRKADVRVRAPLGSVKAHPATVRQVFYNIVSNGLKIFAAKKKSPNRSGLIRERLLRVWVTNRGIGIASQYHQKISASSSGFIHMTAIPALELASLLSKGPRTHGRAHRPGIKPGRAPVSGSN